MLRRKARVVYVVTEDAPSESAVVGVFSSLPRAILEAERRIEGCPEEWIGEHMPEGGVVIPGEWYNDHATITRVEVDANLTPFWSHR